ncbi:MAG: hypothetical protein HW390_264 [Candidatus Brocadiaceae bacterium]|nr:hypothetical protein [Candidatus Brocadiaceae bacterium]
MDKQNSANQKQIHAGISKITDVLAGLEDFFHKTDVDISNDPDDPREGIGRLMGLDRLMCLIPCVLNRLEEDVSNGKEGENISSIIEGLQAIQAGLQSVLAYYQRDDVEVPLETLSNALSTIDHLSYKKPPSGIRIFRDIARIAPDFQIIHNMFEEFLENRRVRPEALKTDAAWSPESWLDYYREQARLEEPLVAVVEAEGLSEASLEKGMKQMLKESEQRDKANERFFANYTFMKNRDAAFNPDYPEKFLYLSEIPDITDEEDDGEHEVRVVDLHYEEEDEPEPWASSLPELDNWNKASQESLYDDPERHPPDFKDDPVYQLLNPFVHDLIKCLKNDYSRRVKESESKEYAMRSPLEHYLIILALKAQARIASSGVHTKSAGHDAPRKGVYLFVMECLEKIAKATHKFSQKHLFHLASEARNIKKQIEEIIE